MISDQDLIRGCLQHDVHAQEVFYRRFAGKMFGVCLRFASDYMEAEDILQEGFIRAFNNLYQFRFEGSLEGWLRRIIVNTAINFVKKQIRHQRMEVNIELASDCATITEDVLSKLSVEELLMMIQRLPVGYRTVFNLYVIEGYNHKEIGLKLGISENTSKSQLFRAKQSIQKELLKSG